MGDLLRFPAERTRPSRPGESARQGVKMLTGRDLVEEYDPPSREEIRELMRREDALDYAIRTYKRELRKARQSKRDR